MVPEWSKPLMSAPAMLPPPTKPIFLFCIVMTSRPGPPLGVGFLRFDRAFHAPELRWCRRASLWRHLRDAEAKALGGWRRDCCSAPRATMRRAPRSALACSDENDWRA